MALDPDLQNYGVALLKAIAKANGHPDPDGYAATVASFFEAPASVDAAQAADGITADPQPTTIDIPPAPDAPAAQEAQ